MSEPTLYQPLGSYLVVARNGTTQSQVSYSTEYPVTRIETIADGTINYEKAGYLSAPASGYELQDGDILYSHINSIKHVGKVAQYHGEKILYHGMNLLLLRLDDEVDKRYFFHFLNGYQAKHYAQRECQKAINQVSLNTAQLKRLSVYTPPLSEQRLIARILDTLDTQIQRTEALISKLEKVKEGLLHDLLTRGTDENGLLRPSPEQAPELYKKSPLGLIPREWRIAHVGEVGEIVTGSTPPSAALNAWGGPYQFFTPADVNDYEPMKVAERTLSDTGVLHVKIVPPESTLVVCIGSTIGKVGFTDCESATNQQINAVSPCSSWNGYFVFQAIRHHVGQIHAWAGLQAVPIVNKSTFSEMLIPQPSFGEQGRISEAMKNLEVRVAEERANVKKLRAEKEGLANDLLTGGIRVA